MEDRTVEFRSLTPSSKSSKASVNTPNNMERGESIVETEVESEGIGLNEFFEVLKKLKKLVERIKAYTFALEKYYRKVSFSTDNSNEGLVLAESIKNDAKECRTLMDLIEKGSPSRIRDLNLENTRKRLVQALMAFENLQREQKSKLRANIRRQYLIINPTASEEDLNRVEQLMKDDIFSEALKEDAKYGLKLMEGRLEEMKEIEKSVSEIQQLWVEISLLIETRGESIVKLGEHLAKVDNYAYKAKNETERGIKTAQSKTKCRRIGLIVLIVFIVFVIFSVWLSFKFS